MLPSSVVSSVVNDDDKMMLCFLRLFGGSLTFAQLSELSLYCLNGRCVKWGDILAKSDCNLILDMTWVSIACSSDVWLVGEQCEEERVKSWRVAAKERHLAPILSPFFQSPFLLLNRKLTNVQRAWNRLISDLFNAYINEGSYTAQINLQLASNS